MRRWIFVVIGVVLAIAGVVWILQGLNLLGQSGGMNGQHIWAIIGVICALAGLGFIAAGVRARPGPQVQAPRGGTGHDRVRRGVRTRVARRHNGADVAFAFALLDAGTCGPSATLRTGAADHWLARREPVGRHA